MAISYVGKGTYQYGTTDPLVPVPAGIQEGDLLLIMFQSESSTATCDTPTGWNIACPIYGGSGTCATAIFWKIATDSESSIQLVSTGSSQRALMTAWRGDIDITNPIEDYRNEVFNSSSPSIQNPTTLYPDAMLINMIGFETSYSGEVMSSWANYSLVSITEGHDQCDTVDVGGGLAFAYGVRTGIHTQNTTATLSNITGQTQTTSLIIKPSGDPFPSPIYVSKSPYASSSNAFNVRYLSPRAGYFLLLLVSGQGDVAIDGATDEGWTPVCDTVTDGTNVSFRVFWKFALGTEGTDYCPIADSGGSTRAIMFQFLNVDEATPILAYVTNTDTGTAFTTANPESTRDNCLLVNCIGFEEADASDFNNYTSWANASLDFIEELHDQLDSAGTGGGIASAYGLKETAGTINNTTANTDSSANVSVCINILLQAPVVDEEVNSCNFFMFM